MELKQVNIKQFKKNIYKYYREIFPTNERKTYIILKKEYEKGTIVILEVVEQNNTIGFMILKKMKNNKYIGLDYFAIYSDFQSKGYGRKAIKKLISMCSNYYGLFIEIEKLGLGKNKEDNEIREKRIKFYEQIGFKKLKNDFKLFNVIYSIYLYIYSDVEENDDEIEKKIFEIYINEFGEKKINKNCKVLISASDQSIY